MNQIITTSDGSHTIFVEEMNEHYHSVHGAVGESLHIFIRNGFERTAADPVNIFEVGFGTGLNALLTAEKCIMERRIVNYTSVEKYPLGPEITDRLNFHLYAGKQGKKYFDLIHSAPWDTWQIIDRYFNLRKISADILNHQITGKYDLIYFDAFGPDKQPEMWTKEVLSMIAEATVEGGSLVTYSSKGEVKRNLRACGFDVSLLPGPPGKRQIIRAIKY